MVRLPPAFLLPVLALTVLLAAPPALAEAGPAWVELTGAGAQARAVADGGACPQATVDGRPAAMAARAASSEAFPTVCALDLPETAASVTVDGKALPVPRPAQRIVVLGDTGCEIKALSVQACNDPRAWPFATVARLAAAKNPDLVIHVGDYYYRESPCPLPAACAGSPHGDRWATWTAEFFDPAAPLLRAAPWVFARGNHESCKRGGHGWFVLLDAGAPPAEPCPGGEYGFVARSGPLTLYVLDSADAPDRGHSKDDTAAVAAQLDRFGPMDLGQGWIVTHRPVWGLVPIARLGPADPFEVGLNFTQQDAVRGRPLAGVQMVVSGHVHHFQAIDFGAGRPSQLVVGTGGDVGIKADKPQVYRSKREMDGLDASAFSFSRFGYYLLQRDGEDWTGEFHDQDDVVRALCRLHGRDLTCRSPK